MKVYVICALLFISLPAIFGYKEITGILESATDLTPEERNVLRPLFEVLQMQYDYIARQASEAGVPNSDEETADASVVALYESTFREFEQYFENLLEQNHDANSDNNGFYDTSLPSVEQLMGQPREDMTPEELNEYADIKAILEDTLDEAQLHLTALVERAQQLSSQRIKINKPKIVEYIYNALSVLFKISVRVSRAAYCTYSHIPQLNETLHSIYDGIDCYSYTTGLVLSIQHETVHTVGTIKSNILDLAAVYKKIAAKHSLLGKLTTVLLNVLRITRDIRESYTVGMQALERLQYELPAAANVTVNCAQDFVSYIPQMIETASNVSTCILFVDDTTEDYDFLKPEAKRNFN